MTSRPADSRKHPGQRLAFLRDLAAAYSPSATAVERSLSLLSTALRKKQVLSRDLCGSCIQVLQEMNKPLVFLCSTFQELASLPDSLVAFSIEMHVAFSRLHCQTIEVLSCLKACYQHIVTSSLQRLQEQQTELHSLLTPFCTQIKSVRRLLRNVLDHNDPRCGENHLTTRHRGKRIVTVIAQQPDTLSDPSSGEQMTQIPQEMSAWESSAALTAYRNLLRQREEQLLDIEKRKVRYIDPRSYPPDLEENEVFLLKEIAHLRSVIAQLEQTDKHSDT